jgi:DNA polymerase
MTLKYTGLREVEENKFVYMRRKEELYVYGGKVVENICQALARCIIGEQMIRISRKYRVALTVHDSIMCVVTKEEADAALKYVTESMQWVPDWAEGLPLGCEASYAKSYGDCK